MLRTVIHMGDTLDWENSRREVVLNTSKDTEIFRQDIHDTIDRLVDEFIEGGEDDI